MNLPEFVKLVNKIKSDPKYFLAENFGCRVNSAEINQLSQILIDQMFLPSNINKNFTPYVIIINTCSITQKGEKESLSKVRQLKKQFPNSLIFVTGCAHLDKVSHLKSVYIFNNQSKENILSDSNCAYTSKIGDKFSHSHKFILKIQSGCTQFCSYCTVPYRRQYLFSLSPKKAIHTINQAVADGYRELIITGVNLEQYQFGFSHLIKNILDHTQIKKISFGSIPLNTIDKTFISLYQNRLYQPRLSNFLHIPLQSGSDKILKLMNRPYTSKDILQKFRKLKLEIRNLKFGTDIIVGFPNETKTDFQKTLTLCQNLGFSKIHTFRFSPRSLTLANYYCQKYPKISAKTLKNRSQKIRHLVS
jgi:threonylcarbamoyladenosine tRNA methylthiotransferase MtaB